jgi:hypothetical protein
VTLSRSRRDIPVRFSEIPTDRRHRLSFRSTGSELYILISQNQIRDAMWVATPLSPVPFPFISNFVRVVVVPVMNRSHEVNDGFSAPCACRRRRPPRTRVAGEWSGSQRGRAPVCTPARCAGVLRVRNLSVALCWCRRGGRPRPAWPCCRAPAARGRWGGPRRSRSRGGDRAVRAPARAAAAAISPRCTGLRYIAYRLTDLVSLA